MVYICVEGSAKIITENYSETINTGETVLMPAALSNFEISTENAKLLEVYV